MGLIRAEMGAVGAIVAMLAMLAMGEPLAPMWVDFLTVPLSMGQSSALFPAVPLRTNHGSGSKTKGSQEIETKASKIVVQGGHGACQQLHMGRVCRKPMASHEGENPRVFAGFGSLTLVS